MNPFMMVAYHVNLKCYQNMFRHLLECFKNFLDLFSLLVLKRNFKQVVSVGLGPPSAKNMTAKAKAH